MQVVGVCSIEVDGSEVTSACGGEDSGVPLLFYFLFNSAYSLLFYSAYSLLIL